MCFNTHFSNIRTRALKRRNIIKIFSHSSWHINKITLSNIYRSFIGFLIIIKIDILQHKATRLHGKQEPQQDPSCYYKVKAATAMVELYKFIDILKIVY